MDCLMPRAANITNISAPVNFNYSVNFSFQVNDSLPYTTLDASNTTSPDTQWGNTREVVRYVITPVVCIFGLLGNSLTLIVMTRKRLASSCDGTERTVNVGLMALAFSDMLCCLALLPHGFQKAQTEGTFSYTEVTFYLVWKVYGDAIINTFFLSSTWLTVTMATSRYLAICHPFKCRHLIGLAGTQCSIVMVFVACVAFNIPRYLKAHVGTIACHDGSRRYFHAPWLDGPLGGSAVGWHVYTWLYFTIGILLPLALLAFCNICLIRALHESSKLRKRYRVPTAHVDANHRITSILVTIVVMYIVLVSPSEIVRFLSRRADAVNVDLIEVTNLLQAINFACDFVLYFILNVHFRQTLRDWAWYMCGRPLRWAGVAEPRSMRRRATPSFLRNQGSDLAKSNKSHQRLPHSASNVDTVEREMVVIS